MVERASAGNDDHVKAAVQLFLDVVNIFIRMMIILVTLNLCTVDCLARHRRKQGKTKSADANQDEHPCLNKMGRTRGGVICSKS